MGKQNDKGQTEKKGKYNVDEFWVLEVLFGKSL